MHRAAAFPAFDASTVASLLNASFALWHADASAAPASGPTATLVVRVRCADGRELQVTRIDDGHELPAWCYGSIDMPFAVAPRAASLARLLSELRMELDCEFVPHALVMAAGSGA